MTVQAGVKRLLLAGVVCLIGSPHGFADVDIRTGSKAHFCRGAEGVLILGQRDEFIQRLSPFDRSARMKTADSVSEDQFLSFVRSNVLAWSPPEQARVEAAIAELKPALETLPIPFPGTILFILTTGAEEGGAFYTRGNAVIMPQKQVRDVEPEQLKRTIAHELFHVVSRLNPELRNKLYQAIGFVKCNEVELPAEIKSRKITNPDAPVNDHAIRVQVSGQEMWGVPMLISKTAKYDPERGGEFFNYLQLQFLISEKPPPAPAKLVDVATVSGFFDQVGRNTDYIIHPEEILAENFALLATGATKLRSPEVVDKMRRILEQK